MSIQSKQMFYRLSNLCRYSEYLQSWTKEPHKEVSHPIFLCYTAASTLRVSFLIDFSCAIFKMFLIKNLYHD